MSRYDDYISRQAAIEALAGWKISPIVLDPVPTADVVEVVRCKDCKWRYSTSDCIHWLPCMDIIYNHDFYCGYGERADT